MKTTPRVPALSSGATMATAEEQARLHVGIIGMGDMGRLYALRMRAAGWQHVHVCDREERYEALRAELREEIREEIRAELRAGLPGAEAQPRKNKKTKGRGRDARRGDAGAEPTTTTLATLAAQEAQEAREAGGSGPVTGPAGGAGPVDGGGR